MPAPHVPPPQPATNPACTATSHGRATDANNHGCTCPEALAARRRQRKHAAHGQPGDPSVDAVGAHRRIEALYADGWTREDVARFSGHAVATISSVMYRLRIRARTAAWVAATYERMVRLPAPTGRIADHQRHVAACRGLAPSRVWDGRIFRLDDPAADPAVAVATYGLHPAARALLRARADRERDELATRAAEAEEAETPGAGLAPDEARRAANRVQMRRARATRRLAAARRGADRTAELAAATAAAQAADEQLLTSGTLTSADRRRVANRMRMRRTRGAARAASRTAVRAVAA